MIHFKCDDYYRYAFLFHISVSFLAKCLYFFTFFRLHPVIWLVRFFFPCLQLIRFCFLVWLMWLVWASKLSRRKYRVNSRKSHRWESNLLSGSNLPSKKKKIGRNPTIYWNHPQRYQSRLCNRRQHRAWKETGASDGILIATRCRIEPQLMSIAALHV